MGCAVFDGRTGQKVPASAKLGYYRIIKRVRIGAEICAAKKMCIRDSYRRLGAVVEQIIQEAGLRAEHIQGVGIGLPALIAGDNQSVFYGKILEITGVTGAEFARYIPYPTALFNDANAAGFAELWINRNLSNCLLYTSRCV